MPWLKHNDSFKDANIGDEFPSTGLLGLSKVSVPLSGTD
jgi:hypothetical protein